MAAARPKRFAPCGSPEPDPLRCPVFVPMVKTPDLRDCDGDELSPVRRVHGPRWRSIRLTIEPVWTGLR